MPLQLHLKALLEDLNPSTVIIEMIAMFSVDTVTGQSGSDSSSNPLRGVQSFAKSNYDQNGKTSKVCSLTIKEKWGLTVL